MAPEVLALIPFLALFLWRIMFSGMERGWLLAEHDVLRRRQNDFFGQGFHIIDPARGILVADELENPADGADPFDRKYRAQNYLRRIVALTGATQKGNCCFLDVDKTQFCIRSGYVTRLQDVADPKRACEETCFYPAYKDMPKAEQIATALLQLKNNPALFDRWAVERSLAFKADGQVFTRTQ